MGISTYRNLKVLIADNSPSVREVIKSILGNFNIKNVDEADNGVSAYFMILHKHYDLVLLDWNIPRMKDPKSVNGAVKIYQCGAVKVSHRVYRYSPDSVPLG